VGCQHLDQNYELFLLGALSVEEDASIREHVERSCPYCLEQLREAALTVYFLTWAGRPERPDPKQKSTLLRRLRKTRA
jgi:hypothetical protein